MVCIGERALRPGLTTLRGNEGNCVEVSAHTDAFSALLLESIDEALTDLLGRKAREAVYDYLERNCLVARNELPARLEAFVTLLDDTFGKGSKTIGRVVAKRLHSKLEWEFVEVPGYGLVDYVEAVKARIGRELVKQTNRA